MFRFFKKQETPPAKQVVPAAPRPAATNNNKFTYRQTLEDLHTESLALQKRFLDVVVKIRENAKKDEPIDEVLLYNRDVLYKKFNKVLNLHRRLRTYAEKNLVLLSDVMPDDIWGRV